MLTVAKYFHWTDRYVLDMPVCRFWSAIAYIERAAKDGPTMDDLEG